MSWFPTAEARIFCAAVNYAAHRTEMGRGERGWLRPGDLVEVEISGMPLLANGVAA